MAKGERVWFRHLPVRRGSRERQGMKLLALFADDADVNFRDVFEHQFLDSLAARLQDRSDALGGGGGSQPSRHIENRVGRSADPV